MAAAQAVPSESRIRKRSFFFALSGDQREFLFSGSNKERLMLTTLSLGFGARDDVHVLEAEGANADGEKNVKMLVQTTAMLGVQPSMPAVTLSSTVLALPVTFRLRSGPGPLYISGSHLVGMEDTIARVMAVAKSIMKVSEEPAQKRANVSSEEIVAVSVAQPLSNPISGAKDSALAMFAAKYGGSASISSSPLPPDPKAAKKAIPEGRNPELRNYYDQLKQIKNEKVLDRVKAKIMESVAKGVRLSVVKYRFERFLEHCHNVTEPNMVAELWKWRQTFR